VPGDAVKVKADMPDLFEKFLLFFRQPLFGGGAENGGTAEVGN
jgi:hypothetical protein